jgi:4-amino-4-deoxy-L-arabinose transferase-like glycosyltransferase
MTLTPPSWRDHLLGALLCLLTFSLLVSTSDEVGVPRDESFYFYAGDRAADWVLGLFDGDVRSFSRAEIDRGFSYNHEHPVLMKTLFGLSHRIFHDRLGWVDAHILSYRLPSMFMAGLAVWLTSLLGTMLAGRGVGLVAGLALLFMPRVYFHSHFACFDGPVTFMWLLIVYTWLRALRSLRWAPAAGVALGLGLATKLNTFFVPFLLLLVTLYDVWSFKRRTGAARAPDGQRGPASHAVATGLSMVFLGTFVFFAHWPWLWFDTWPRLKEYVAFHSHHVNYPVAYLGTLWYDPPFPVHYPFVMSLTTLPVTVLLFGAVGLALLVRDAWAHLVAGTRGDADVPPVSLAFVANIAVPFLIIAAPYTPIFGGVKHWMPAMPFLAVAVGLGVARAVRGALSLATPPAAWATGLAGVLLLVPAAADTLRDPGSGEAHFNELVGGAAGAAELDLPRNFWGYATLGALPALNEKAEKGALAFWHDATKWAFDAYQRDGLLRKDVRYTGDWTAAYSNWALYHDQRDKFWEELDIWRAYGTDFPVDGRFHEGVQLLGLYQRPAAPSAPAALRPKVSAPPAPASEGEAEQGETGGEP